MLNTVKDIWKIILPFAKSKQEPEQIASNKSRKRRKQIAAQASLQYQNYLHQLNSDMVEMATLPSAHPHAVIKKQIPLQSLNHPIKIYRPSTRTVLDKVKAIQEKQEQKQAPLVSAKSKPTKVSVYADPSKEAWACMLTLGVHWGVWARRTLFELSFALNIPVEAHIFNFDKPYTHYANYTYSLRYFIYKAEKKLGKRIADHRLLRKTAFFPPIFIYHMQKSINRLHRNMKS